MTNPDTIRALKITFAAVVYLASLSVIVMAQNSTMDSWTDDTQLIAILVATILLIFITFLWLKSLGIMTNRSEPIAPSARKSQKTLAIACAVGGLMAFAFIFTGDLEKGGANLFSYEPVAPAVAIALALAFTSVCIFGGLRWLRNADEHERAAVTWGTYVGMLAFCLIVPCWWMLERASLVPPQEPMIVYAVVLTVYSAAWTYKRGA